MSENIIDARFVAVHVPLSEDLAYAEYVSGKWPHRV